MQWLLLTNNVVVLLLSLRPKLLALSPLRTQLALPLVQQTRTLLDDHSNGVDLLHRHMGHHPLDTRHSIKMPRMVCTDICYWTRRTEMVSNALVDFEYWVVCTLGREFCGQYAYWTGVVAMAWCIGCVAGRW